MKRKDLMKRMRRFARAKGLAMEIREGGSHTVIRIGDRQSAVPRHREINELTARAIIEHMEEG